MFVTKGTIWHKLQVEQMHTIKNWTEQTAVCTIQLNLFDIRLAKNATQKRKHMQTAPTADKDNHRDEHDIERASASRRAGGSWGPWGHVPRQRDLGVASSTASRSSLRVHTSIGPGASSGTFSPRPTSTSAPGGPMDSSAWPTRPPPTTTAGCTAVAAIAAETLASLRAAADLEEARERRRRRGGHGSGVTETAALRAISTGSGVVGCWRSEVTAFGLGTWVPLERQTGATRFGMGLSGRFLVHRRIDGLLGLGAWNGFLWYIVFLVFSFFSRTCIRLYTHTHAN